MRSGDSFESTDVAKYYRYRPEYPDGVYKQLLELSPAKNLLLDLGCGTGKIARGLCRSFNEVVAVDPSVAMLNVARDMKDGDADNITWIEALAESYDIVESPDLIVAAASIHWMDHAVLFPKLLDRLSSRYVFAVVEGDTAHNPPWQKPWDLFLAKWLRILRNEAYEPNRSDSNYNLRMARHRQWLNIQGESFSSSEVTQSIEDFIRCQHSRDTFAPANMMGKMDEFDNELRRMLQPYAADGMLAYTVQARIEWGEITLV